MQINDPELQKKAKKIKNEIERLIEQGLLGDAEEALDNYDEIVWDAESYSMRAIIKIMQNRNDDAENILLNALEKDPFDFDLNYNLGYLFEQKGLHLKALETYEKALFNINSSDKQKTAMEAIYNLEKSFCNIIQNQLEDKLAEGSFEGNGVNLHLMYDSIYCERYITFINGQFDNKKHLFIIMCDDKDTELKYVHTNSHNVIKMSIFEDIEELIQYMNKSSKVFIHYLFDYICELMCKFDIKSPTYWIVWGGDIYNYIDTNLFDEHTVKLLESIGYKISTTVNKDNIKNFYRKSAIRKINYILANIEGDIGEFGKIKENYITVAKHLPFIYPNPIDLNLLDQCINDDSSISHLKNGYKYMVLVGNSSSAGNNHIDILYKMSKIESKDFCIVMPLSYGGIDKYVNKLIKEGKRLFGERFIPITDFLSPEEYFCLLKQVDIAIFNHNRQQAFGNMIALFCLGKKIYIKTNTTLYPLLRMLNIDIYDVSDLDNASIENVVRYSDNSANNNKKNILDIYNDKTALNYSKNVFDNL